MAFNFPQEFIFLSTQTASSSASLSFTSVISTNYPLYYAKIRNLIPATNATSLLLTFSTDNGSTYLNSGYQWGFFVYYNNGTANLQSNSDTSISLSNTTSNVSSRDGINGEIYLYGLGQNVVPTIYYKTALYDSNSTNSGITCSGSNTGTTAINAIKFTMSAGNIASGTIDFYGMTI